MTHFLDLLDDERLTKMNLLISNLKMRYSKKLNEQINDNDKDYQQLEEKLSIDENLIKKIREMKRRKVKFTSKLPIKIFNPHF